MKSFIRLVDRTKRFPSIKTIGHHKRCSFFIPPDFCHTFSAPRTQPFSEARWFFFWNETGGNFMKKFWENNFAPENFVARWWRYGDFGPDSFWEKKIIGSASYKTVNQLMKSWSRSRSQCDNEPSKTFKIGHVSYCKVQSMVVVRRFGSIYIQRMKYFCLVLVSLCFLIQKSATPRCTLLGSPTHRVHGSRMTGQDLFRGKKGPKSWQKQNK